MNSVKRGCSILTLAFRRTMFLGVGVVWALCVATAHAQDGGDFNSFGTYNEIKLQPFNTMATQENPVFPPLDFTIQAPNVQLRPDTMQFPDRYARIQTPNTNPSPYLEHTWRGYKSMTPIHQSGFKPEATFHFNKFKPMSE